jgi:hypothetical protein
VNSSEEDLSIQTKLSMRCYKEYHELQAIREKIDQALPEGKRKWKKGQQENWRALRGEGNPEDGDILYGSIYANSPENETLTSLQHKFLFLLNTLQSCDDRPTAQQADAVDKLLKQSIMLSNRWKAIQ